ncbi:calcium release-activated calcium channel protein 1 [Tetranychus urticae]|uniref:calcium release-activated calcium channel protein 1 n=1 Tax=Tetranychus urticae TaxID=32264 RepID=UPI00077BC311|nr:calcium release-activated calcium channel protein 1 [Tetranychus urticae]
MCLTINNENAIPWKRIQLKRSKLKSSVKTSSMLAGFAIVAMVEVSFQNEPDNPVPPYLLMIFGINSITLVSVHMLALMISICILPSLDEICEANSFGKINPNSSPAEELSIFIEIAWILSNVVGLLLFLIECVICCWLKFWENGSPRGEPGKHVAFAATILFLPILVTFVFFANHFYRSLVKYNLQRSTFQLKEVENLALGLRTVFPIETSNLKPDFGPSRIMSI